MAEAGGDSGPAIWIDADGCPAVIKEILFKGARRARLPMTLVANHPMRVPPDPSIRLVQVGQGFDVADHYIVAHCRRGDLVISSDIPLAAEAVAKGAQVLTSRGEVLDRHNVRARLSVRNFMSELRDAGVDTGGPRAMAPRDRQAFGNALDRWLQRNTPRQR